jgi:hypothetical protein
MKWSIGCGFPGVGTTFSFQVTVPAVRTLSRPTGLCWPSGLISWPAGIVVGSCSGRDVFKEAVMSAGAIFGTVSRFGRSSGWARMDVNQEDPVELALAIELQRSALAHAAET